MFTGIVDHTGNIKEVSRSERGIALTVESRFQQLSLGESISINGVCLTVTQFSEASFCVEISPETEKLTTFSHIQVGDLVNLERALKAEDRFGGHWVTGHVEQTARVEKVVNHAEFKELKFSGIDPARKSYITSKGSITVNGVSLTVNEVSENGFAVMLIPHTLERTNLCLLKPGSEVNIECDWMAKIIVNEVRNLLGSMAIQNGNKGFSV